MEKPRRRGASEEPREADLPAGRRQEILAAHDEADLLLPVVDRDGELIRPVAAAIANQRIAALFGRIRYEAPPPLEIGVSLHEEGSVTNKTIVATIRGTVSCSSSVPVDLNGTLTQVQARGVVVSGTFSTRVDCSSPSVAWSANVLADSGKFGAGSATATVTASGCRTGCTTASATRTVKLNLGKS